LKADFGESKPSEIRRVAIKDNICTSDFNTTCASAFLESYKSPYDATVVERLQQSHTDASNDGHHGYHIRGKTNMDEFGMGSHSMHSHFGAVKARFGRSAGGSSGGSAVALATHAAEIALGTDTGGSVRLPAAYSGIYGFKPSYGAIPRYGVVPYANSLDTVGLLARQEDEEMNSVLTDAFQKLRTHDSRDPTSPSFESRKRMTRRNKDASREFCRSSSEEVKPLRIGVPMEYNISELSKPVRDTWQHVLDTLQAQGHTIVPVSLPSTKQALSAYYVIAAAEAASNLAKYDGVRYGSRGEGSDGAGDVLYANTRGEGFGEEVKRRILLGSYTLSSEAINNYFIQAQKVRRLVQRDFDRVFAMPNPLRPEEQFDLSEMEEGLELESKLGPAQVDVLVCPTAPTLPPLLEEVASQTPIDAYMNDVFTVPASLAGLPALSIPVRIPKSKLNNWQTSYAGIQVIGQYWDDDYVLRVGKMIRQLSGPKVDYPIGGHGSIANGPLETLATDTLKVLNKVAFTPKGDGRPNADLQVQIRSVLKYISKGVVTNDTDEVENKSPAWHETKNEILNVLNARLETDNPETGALSAESTVTLAVKSVIRDLQRLYDPHARDLVIRRVQTDPAAPNETDSKTLE
jgi:aspartyl-tRNA(Asn)/glutamyl-tRNA(Gln) amidotransferase subunit A